MSISDAVAAVATSAVAAVEAAALTTTGGREPCEPAWVGETNPEDKQRLRGSIVKLSNDKWAYLPVASTAVVVKSFGARSEDGA